MRALGGVWRYCPRLFGKGEIGITRQVGLLHGHIAAQGGGNAKLLLFPVEISNSIAWLGFDQAANPDTRSEDVLGIGGLVTARAGLEGAQQTPVTAIATDREVLKPQFGQIVAQLAQGRDLRVGFGLMAECIVAEVK